jgi:hypothetical protein
MALYQLQGYRRLAVGISALTFFASLLILFTTSNKDEFVVYFIYIPVVSVLISGSVYCLIRLVYWIVDGFKTHV